MVADLARPEPKRAQNSMKALTEAADTAAIAPKPRAHHPMIGARRTRSASQPMGSTPSTTKAAEAEVMKTIVPSLTPSEVPMSGPSTDMAAVSSSSRLLISSRTRKV